VTLEGTSGPAPARTLASTALAAWRGTRLFRPILVLTILLFIILAATQSDFLTTQNIQNLMTGDSALWIISLGMTFVLITAGADLSVSAISALTGIFLAKIISGGVPGWPAVLLTLIFGSVLGAVINGGLIGRFRLSFFVVTLASMTALTGAVNLWSGTQSFAVNSPVALQIGVNNVLGLPAPIWIMIVTFVVSLWLQRWTYFGRDVYAVGGSIRAARLSGIRTTRTLLITYGISAFCATIAGIITVGRIGVAAPNVDANLPLQAIAAVLLGGTSLTGGSGGVGGTILGVVFLGMLQNGLSIAGVPSFWQQVVTGVILILAVLGDHLGLIGDRLRRRSRGGGGPAPGDGDPGAAAEAGGAAGAAGAAAGAAGGPGPSLMTPAPNTAGSPDPES
jgi:ribose/xylose/arabinose/galactoside ABC-type transport system permease subunit